MLVRSASSAAASEQSANQVSPVMVRPVDESEVFLAISGDILHADRIPVKALYGLPLRGRKEH